MIIHRGTDIVSVMQHVDEFLKFQYEIWEVFFFKFNVYCTRLANTNECMNAVPILKQKRKRKGRKRDKRGDMRSGRATLQDMIEKKSLRFKSSKGFHEKN